MSDAVEEKEVRDEEGALRADFVRAVETALQSGDVDGIRKLAGDLRDADLADLIETLRPEHRYALIETLGSDFNPAALSELDEQVRDQVLEAMPTEQVAEAVRELDSDDAVYLLEDMEAEDQKEILDKLPREERIALRRSLDYPEDSAGRLMQSEVIAVPPFWSVGQTIDYMREEEDLPNNFSEIFVVDADYHLVGSVPLSRLLRNKRPVLIKDIMKTDVHPVTAEEDQEEVARDFERYDLYSAPVVDEKGRLVGVITVDDVVEVIQEEAEEDIHRLGGVGDESVADTVIQTARSRLPWLIINMFTAFVAASVILFFEATIEAVVSVAVLMPVNAALGGNAGTQALTVAVRALATQQLNRSNMARIIGREVMVGMCNGFTLALLAGALAGVALGNLTLGLVLSCAMVLTIMFATTLGILVPLGLNRLRIDPAVASGVFVTTTADVFGFFIFLSFATIAFGLW